MSEEGTNTSTDTDSSTGDSAQNSMFSQADVDRIVADRLSREKDKSAKKYGDYDQLKAAAAELEQLKAQTMSEQEKAVKTAATETEARVRAEEHAKAAARLARAELRAAAAGRVEEKALKGFLDYADLTKFVGDDGEPNEKAIAAVVKDLAGSQATDFDGGARSTATTSDMNSLIRQKAGLG